MPSKTIPRKRGRRCKFAGSRADSSCERRTHFGMFRLAAHAVHRNRETPDLRSARFHVLNQTVTGAEEFGQPIDDELKAGEISIHSDLLSHGPELKVQSLGESAAPGERLIVASSWLRVSGNRLWIVANHAPNRNAKVHPSEGRSEHYSGNWNGCFGC
jgi:hypothetical protein